jgi:hypothetical protein
LRQHTPVAQKFSFIVLSFLGHNANTLSKGHDGMKVRAAPLPSLFIELYAGFCYFYAGNE